MVMVAEVGCSLDSPVLDGTPVIGELIRRGPASREKRIGECRLLGMFHLVGKRG